MLGVLREARKVIRAYDRVEKEELGAPQRKAAPERKALEMGAQTPITLLGIQMDVVGVLGSLGESQIEIEGLSNGESIRVNRLAKGSRMGGRVAGWADAGANERGLMRE